MGFWVISFVHLIIVYQISDTSFADSTFSPVINNNAPSTQPAQTGVLNTAVNQQSPFLFNDVYKTSTQRPAQPTETLRALPNKPASVTDLQRVPAIRSTAQTDAPLISTPRQTFTTEIPNIATTLALSSTSNIPSTTGETSSPTQFSPVVSQTESLKLSTSTTTKSPTITNVLSNVTPSSSNTANNNATSSIPSNRTILPKFANLGAPVQLLTPQKSRPKDTKCSNNSDCNNGICNENKCFCSPGYSGLKCQIRIDACASSPCFNNATCLDKGGYFECTCSPGYKGELCESEINMCQDNPCANNATCINYLSRYECQCQNGFKGDQCEVNIDDCYSKPCMNNGTCIDGINKYTCDCKSTGYKGDHCETNIDDCESKPCAPSARRCIDLVNGFKCECHEGFTGVTCEVDIKECENSPCLNGGMCIEKSKNIQHLDSLQSSFNYSQYAGYKCECPEEYQGTNCEEKKKCYSRAHIDLCGKPSALCLDNIDGSYDCQINASFDGTHQHYAEYSLVRDFKKFKLEEIKVKYRSVKGGVILSFVTSLQSFVELQLNETGLYLNGSSIELSENTENLLDGREHEFHVDLHLTDIEQILLARSLSEQSSFKGCLMQVRLNNQFLPFYNYGDEANQIFNITHLSYDPERCLVCFENDCLNNGQCDVDNSDGFSCNCPSTFTGIRCEDDVDECKAAPCIHGQCENSVGGYQCNCYPGFSGKACDNISDHCLAERPCHASGICKSNGSSSFSCECPSSRIGKLCERERTCFNECNEKNSQCIQNRTCACLPNINLGIMENAMCEAISSCDKHEGLLCRNGGTCSSLIGNGYQCLCPEGFQGPICEVPMPRTNDVILFVVIACIGLLLATCAVVSLIIFKSVRRARATQGTYSPQTEEIYGERMFADNILKVPPTERLI